MVSPFVSLPDRSLLTWNNQLVNEVSSIVAAGHIAADMGLPVRTMTYVMTLVVEQTTEGTSRKIRALLIRKDVLKSLVTTPEPTFEHKSYLIRWRTLLQMAAAAFPEQRGAILERLHGADDSNTPLAHVHEKKTDFSDVKLTELELVLPCWLLQTHSDT